MYLKVQQQSNFLLSLVLEKDISKDVQGKCDEVRFELIWIAPNSKFVCEAKSNILILPTTHPNLAQKYVQFYFTHLWSEGVYIYISLIIHRFTRYMSSTPLSGEKRLEGNQWVSVGVKNRDDPFWFWRNL